MPAIDTDLLQRAFISRIETLEKELFDMRIPAEGIVLLVLEGDDCQLPLAEQLRHAHGRLQTMLAKARQAG